MNAERQEQPAADTAPPALPFDDLHRESHLSRTRPEATLCDFEFALHHVIEAFRRWSESVHALVGDTPLPLQDVSVLQLLRMRDRPKTTAEVARALNREDLANVVYSLRKLERLELAQRLPDLPQRQTTYAVTERGRAVTDAYADLRRRVLLKSLEGMPDLQAQMDAATRLLTLMTGQYDYGARRAEMYRPAATTTGNGTTPDAAPQD